MRTKQRTTEAGSNVAALPTPIADIANSSDLRNLVLRVREKADPEPARAHPHQRVQREPFSLD